MLFRYDFDKNLDLSRFNKQAEHYISCMPEVVYNLFVFDYKIIVHISKVEQLHNMAITLYEIKRDTDGEIISSNVIYPLRDIRFQEMSEIVNMLPDENSEVGHFKCNSPNIIVEKLSSYIKMLNKLNSLKAFF